MPGVACGPYGRTWCQQDPAEAATARETLATHADLERVRQRHDEQTQRLRADLEAARQHAETRATELIRLQLHEAALGKSGKEVSGSRHKSVSVKSSLRVNAQLRGYFDP